MNPYRIEGPAVVSFSGGRTSAFMLRNILDAHAGSLPSDVHVCFQNTGLEHPATYAFIERVGREWRVPITWLEYCTVDGKHAFKSVTPSTASRRGDPFTALILKKQYLPNPVTRFCTVELKIRTLRRFVVSLGWDDYTNCIGLRADEPRRVAKMRGDVKAEDVRMPIAEAGHTIKDVLSFWSASPFDLELPGGTNAWGNCMGCFLKGPHKLQRLMAEDPDKFTWWEEAEKMALNTASSGARFRNDRPSYRAMLEMARTQATFPFDTEEDSISCACTD